MRGQNRSHGHPEICPFVGLLDTEIPDPGEDAPGDERPGEEDRPPGEAVFRRPQQGRYFRPK